MKRIRNSVRPASVFLLTTLLSSTPALCQTLRTDNYVGGVADDCAPPLDPVYRGDALTQWSVGQTLAEFDNVDEDRVFGHTFQPLPPGITAATLEIRMRPNGQFSLSNNDDISLGLDEMTSTFGWRLSIRNLPEAGGTWVPGQPATTFVLDLAALPGGANLLNELNASQRLDIAVRDDTCVDYCRLDVTTNNMTIGGTAVAALGGAQLVANPAGGFNLMLAPGGMGGVAFPIGPIQAQGRGAQGFCLTGELCDNSPFFNSVTDWVCSGYNRTVQGAAVCTEATLSIGPKPGAPGVAQVSVFGNGMFTSCIEVQVFNGNVPTPPIRLEPPAATGVVIEFPSNVCSQAGGFDFIDGRCFFLRRLDQAVTVTIPTAGGGTEVRTGDSIKICDCVNQMAGVTQARFQVQNFARAQLQLGGMALALQGDVLATADGGAQLRQRPDKLAITDLATAPACASLLLGSAANAAAIWSPESLQFAANGQGIQAALHGRPTGSMMETLLGTLRFDRNGLWRRATLSSPLGATRYTVEILRNGQSVFRQSNLANPTIEAAQFPIGLGAAGGSRVGFLAQMNANIPIRINGSVTVGTHLSICADDGATVQDYTKLKISTNGVDEIELDRVSITRKLTGGCAGAAGTPAASATTLPLIGTTWTLQVSNAAPNALAACHIGLGSTSIALPGGCVLLVEPAVARPALTDGAGQARTSLTIPFDPSILGLKLAAQFVIAEPGGPLFGIVTLSDGIEGVIG